MNDLAMWLWDFYVLTFGHGRNVGVGSPKPKGKGQLVTMGQDQWFFKAKKIGNF